MLTTYECDLSDWHPMLTTQDYDLSDWHPIWHPCTWPFSVSECKPHWYSTRVGRNPLSLWTKSTSPPTHKTDCQRVITWYWFTADVCSSVQQLTVRRRDQYSNNIEKWPDKWERVLCTFMRHDARTFVHPLWKSPHSVFHGVSFFRSCMNNSIR